MELTAERASALSVQVRLQDSARGRAAGENVRLALSAVSDLVRRVNESTVRRFWEWVAIGFAFRGYTPL